MTATDTTPRTVALAGMVGWLQASMDAETLGEAVESWARFMAASGLSKPAAIATLKLVVSHCPLVSLARACATLDVDMLDVVAEVMA